MEKNLHEMPWKSYIVRRRPLHTLHEASATAFFLKPRPSHAAPQQNEKIDCRLGRWYHRIMFDAGKLTHEFLPSESIVLFPGDCLQLLKTIPAGSLKLVITSPPYNIGKEYEKKLKLETYVEQQAAVIRECVRCLSPEGSICWQVGNYVDSGAIIPLDTVLYPCLPGLD
jgi:hypothetical protein